MCAYLCSACPMQTWTWSGAISGQILCWKVLSLSHCCLFKQDFQCVVESPNATVKGVMRAVMMVMNLLITFVLKAPDISKCRSGFHNMKCICQELTTQSVLYADRIGQYHATKGSDIAYCIRKQMLYWDIFNFRCLNRFFFCCLLFW